MISDNMGLTIWSIHDGYDYQALSSNWALVDDHDHTSGNGEQISTASFADDSITTAKLANGVVPPTLFISQYATSYFQNASITSTSFANHSVGPTQLSVLPGGALQGGSQSVNGPIQFSSIAWDTNNSASVTRNAVIAPVGGIYYILGQVGFSSAQGSNLNNWSGKGIGGVSVISVTIEIVLNGKVVSENSIVEINGPASVQVETFMALSPNDVITLQLAVPSAVTISSAYLAFNLMVI